MSKSECLDLPISAIHVEAQIRKQFDDSADRALSATIADVGVQQPIRVRADGNGKFTLIMGERRLRGAKLAGLETIPAIVETETLNESDILQRQWIENVHRQDLNPLEKCLAIDALMKSTGKTAAQVAKELGIDPSMVTRLLSLLGLPESIQIAVRDGRVSLASAYELSKERDVKKREARAARLLNGELTVEQAARERRSPSIDTSIEGCSRFTFWVDAQVRVQVVGPRLSTMQQVIDAIESMLSRSRKSKSLTPATAARLSKEEARPPSSVAV